MRLRWRQLAEKSSIFFCFKHGCCYVLLCVPSVTKEHQIMYNNYISINCHKAIRMCFFKFCFRKLLGQVKFLEKNTFIFIQKFQQTYTDNNHFDFDQKSIICFSQNVSVHKFGASNYNLEGKMLWKLNWTDTCNNST